MKLHKIRWKPRATRQNKMRCLFIIECLLDGSVVPLRADGSHAISHMRANVWLVL